MTNDVIYVFVRELDYESEEVFVKLHKDNKEDFLDFCNKLKESGGGISYTASAIVENVIPLDKEWGYCIMDIFTFLNKFKLREDGTTIYEYITGKSMNSLTKVEEEMVHPGLY